MADKKSSGFEISKGEPLTIGDEACSSDPKRVISMIDEHLTEEKFDGSYNRRSRWVGEHTRCCRRWWCRACARALAAADSAVAGGDGRASTRGAAAAAGAERARERSLLLLLLLPEGRSR